MNVEMVLNMFAKNRIACVTVDETGFSKLCLKLGNLLECPLVTLTMPEYDRIRFSRFVTGALHTLCDAAQNRYEDKLHGVVSVFLGDDDYLGGEGQEMVLALLELLSKTTIMAVVLAGSTEKLTRMLAGAASLFGVPGIVKLETETDCQELLKTTSVKLGIPIERNAFREAVELCEQVWKIPEFRFDTMLRAMAGDKAKVTAMAVEQERNDENSYFRMCMQFAGKQPAAKQKTEKRIGFLSKAEREEADYDEFERRESHVA